MCKETLEGGGYPTGGAVLRSTSSRLIGLPLWIAVANGFLVHCAARATQDSPNLNGYVYSGGDLGAVYTPQATTLKLWAPTARNVGVVLFADATNQDFASIPMSRDADGIWSAR